MEKNQTTPLMGIDENGEDALFQTKPTVDMTGVNNSAAIRKRVQSDLNNMNRTERNLEIFTFAIPPNNIATHRAASSSSFSYQYNHEDDSFSHSDSDEQ